MGMRSPVLCLSAALLAAGCDIQVGEKGVTSIGITEGRAEDAWTRAYTLQPGGTLEIVNVNGTIEATGVPGGQVEILAERVVRDHSTENAEARLKKVQMREEVSPTRVRIEAEPPRNGGILDHSSFTVRYIIRVPAGIAVDLKGDNGEIRLDGLSAKVTASTTNGGVNGRALSGPVSVEVTNGGVQLDLAAVGGDVHISTTNGGVRLSLPVGLKATLDATCVNGGIDVDEGLMLQESEESPRRLAGTFNGGGPKISLATVNGGIRIRDRPTGRPD